MKPELPIINWLLSDPSPPNYKVKHKQQQSIIKWKWYRDDRAHIGLRAQVNYIKKEPTPATLPSLSQLYLWVSAYGQITEEEKTQTWFNNGSA